MEMEIQKKKIEHNYARDLEDFKHKAQDDAERNISTIERNI